MSIGGYPGNRQNWEEPETSVDRYFRARDNRLRRANQRGAIVIVIGADIGGTNCRFGLFDSNGDRLRLLHAEILPSARFRSVEEVLTRFLRDLEVRPAAAAFGVPGPVRDGHSQTTNLPWRVDQSKLSVALGGHPAVLLNDLEAQAWGIEWLAEDDWVELQAGVPNPEGNRAILAAGTGLGQAGLCRSRKGYRPFATEGGHTDFAPANRLEMDLLGWLAIRFGHVSWERLVSGPGLENIFDFLNERAATPDRAALDAETDDRAAAIAQAAAGGCPLCTRALGVFVELYGAEAGNLALKMMATGGLYLGGGIAPKLLPKLQQGGFLARFRAKGRFEALMESIPVRVITHPHAALLGAAGVALRRLLSETQTTDCRGDAAC
jgi:glucokinase